MILVVGLGNPGERYRHTRHNIGFQVLDRLAAERPESEWRAKYDARVIQLEFSGTRALFLKPQTYMNRSGLSVRAAAQYFRTPPDEILVVHDELDLPFGQLRLKRGGGDAGHNGLKSISQELGSAVYGRLRVGIGRPGPDFSGTIADYVLQAFAPAELALLPDVVAQGARAIELTLVVGLVQAMNQVNQRPKSTATGQTN